jgi:hypothetical protein
VDGSYVNFMGRGPISEPSYHRQAAARPVEESLIDL